MITWLNVVVAVIMVAAAVTHMLRRPGGSDRWSRHDPHWGDWPPDQMAP